MNQDYIPYFRRMLLCPLQRQGAEGAGQAVQLMDQYHLIREDVDSIMEISVWGGQTHPYAKLDPKVRESWGAFSLFGCMSTPGGRRMGEGGLQGIWS